MFEWMSSLSTLGWAAVGSAGGVLVIFVVRKFFSVVYSALGLERIEDWLRTFVHTRILRRKLYNDFTLTPAEDNEVDYVREQLNRYLAPGERHLDNSSIERFRKIRKDDYLILRGPVEQASVDARYGVAIIHPLLADFGKRFEDGRMTGADLKPHMLKPGKVAKYVYISFAKADDGMKNALKNALAERIAENVKLRMDGRICIIARPTTDEALKLLQKRGFKRCKPRGASIEVRQTCFKWEAGTGTA